MSGLRRPYLRSGSERRAVAARLRAGYEAGASVADLVDRHGISRGTVQRLLHEAGTTMRVPPPPLRPATAADLDALVDSWLCEEPTAHGDGHDGRRIPGGS
ncbi:helix-turn-helix domain-containing protein [Streptomyces europaeiscabiei]|uniref:helix-turn-helix domain-containing protein n=1 Tax=Streptomyces europaeiscabiei TaxID=146819 RepID=UPI002E12FC17|nr:helix-turn-helix domain-containing protein [Streptomyces europaeiscabiei]